jgi:hypothetical protein
LHLTHDDGEAVLYAPSSLLGTSIIVSTCSAPANFRLHHALALQARCFCSFAPGFATLPFEIRWTAAAKSAAEELHLKSSQLGRSVA